MSLSSVASPAGLHHDALRAADRAGRSSPISGWGVDLQPKLDLPFVFVTTTLRGASVEEMETQVTRPIEEAVNTIEGVDELRSITGEGVSRVYVRFAIEKSPDVAAQEVQNKVNAMVAQLPRGTTCR
jgi:HAE1 family hydrophobic/amphiphilic exporter-1